MDIEKRLLELNVQQLHRVCKQCDIAGKDNEAIKDKTRRALVKHVIKFCERDELLQEEDEGMSVLLQLSDVLDALLQEHPAETDDAGAPPVSSSPVITEGREETARLQQPASEGQREDSTPLQPSWETAAARDDGAPHRGRDSINTGYYASSSGFRKDFRINGHVGESTSRDNLSFSSLEHQIESGIRKGYPNMEIVEAVIRAVSPGLKLRSYLEGKTDLTLATLRQILRAHYAEKDATVLYQQLTKAVQGPGETALDFLVRVLDLRQKILFASERAQSGLKYNRELVQSQCSQSIMTGLSNDNIRAEMRIYLQDENSSDELLLQKMQTAQYNENERAQKIKGAVKATHRASLNSVEKNGDGTDTLSTTIPAKPSKQTKENPLFTKIEESNTAIRELTGQVASLVQTVQRSRQTDDNNQPKIPANAFRRPKRRCVVCQQDNSDCNHCFKCGSDTHWAKGCRVGGRQNHSGNGRRL